MTLAGKWPHAAGAEDIRTVQALFVHRDLRATMISTHTLNRGGCGVKSLLDNWA